jgi:hypothetical protein
MYIVKYQKLAKNEDGTIGNVSQGSSTAYMECKFRYIEQELTNYLKKAYDDKVVPVINQVNYYNGHLVF